MFRLRSCLAVFAISCVLFVPLVGQAAAVRSEEVVSRPSPFTEDEQREILSALKELEVARQQVVQLRDVIKKDELLIASLQKQVETLDKIVEAQGRMLQAAERIVDLQTKAIDTYQKIAAMAEERAKRAEDRADRKDWMAILGPIGFALGALLTAIIL